MIFEPTTVEGAFLVRPEPIVDQRGSFARAFCDEEFGAQGLATRFVQSNVSYSRARGTLRGMHYQAAPAEEAKLVRCTVGRVFDAIVDLRPASPSYLETFTVELAEGADSAMLYVPEGVAHGFLTLTGDCELFYQMSERYTPGAARGVRWDDPAFGIDWPAEVAVISERDASWPDYQVEGR